MKSAAMNSELEVKLRSIPPGPGVYMYKDAHGAAIYIGKARSLRSRVRTYFQQSRPMDPRLDQMRALIHDVDFFVTDTEGEALALENQEMVMHRRGGVQADRSRDLSHRRWKAARSQRARDVVEDLRLALCVVLGHSVLRGGYVHDTERTFDVKIGRSGATGR